MSPQQAWDAYQKYQQYKGEGASEGASSGTSTTGAGSSAAGGEQGLGYMSGTGSTTAYSSGYPVQGMAGGQATAGSQGLGYMGGTGSTAGGSQGLGYMGGTGSTAGGGMWSSAGSAGPVAVYAILGSLGQKWATKEQMSDDPDRGPTSRKARVFSALAPSAMHAIKDPKGEGIYQLTGHSPVMSLLGKDQGKKGETESEGYKIWEWIGKLFD